MTVSEARKAKCSHVQGEPIDSRYYEPKRQKECNKPAEFEVRIKLEDKSFVWAPMCRDHARKFEGEDIRLLVPKPARE